jgi:hypothetical protein
MVQNGKNLSMHNGAIWKGTYTNNGMLLKLHENSYTIGYSALLSPNGTSAGKVKFGDGVFYDAHQKNNKVYAGAPTVTSAVPKFAGIVVREPGIASGYPAINDEVADFQKGMLAKEGYIEYKEAYVVTTASHSALGDKKSVFDNVDLGYVLMVSASNGAVYFAQTSSDKVSASDVYVGKIASMNPDDKTVTVYISPAIYA